MGVRHDILKAWRGGMLLALLCAATAGAQTPLNDTCDMAVINGFFLGDGSNPGLTNVGATVSGVAPSCAQSATTPIPIPANMADVWYVYTATLTCTLRIETSNSALAFPLLAVWDGNSYQGPSSCGSLPELACASSLTSAGGPGQTQAQVSVNVGDLLFIQVADVFATSGSFSIDIHPDLSLSFSSPAGPGSLAIANHCGTPNFTYVTAIDLNQGLTPNGWFFGLDISFTVLMHQVYLGPPFFGALDATGSSLYTLPAGIPSGITFYAVTVILDPVTGSPGSASGVVTYVTP